MVSLPDVNSRMYVYTRTHTQVWAGTREEAERLTDQEFSEAVQLIRHLADAKSPAVPRTFKAPGPMSGSIHSSSSPATPAAVSAFVPAAAAVAAAGGDGEMQAEWPGSSYAGSWLAQGAVGSGSSGSQSLSGSNGSSRLESLSSGGPQPSSAGDLLARGESRLERGLDTNGPRGLEGVPAEARGALDAVAVEAVNAGVDGVNTSGLQSGPAAGLLSSQEEAGEEGDWEEEEEGGGDLEDDPLMEEIDSPSMGESLEAALGALTLAVSARSLRGEPS